MIEPNGEHSPNDRGPQGKSVIWLKQRAQDRAQNAFPKAAAIVFAQSQTFMAKMNVIFERLAPVLNSAPLPHCGRMSMAARRRCHPVAALARTRVAYSSFVPPPPHKLPPNKKSPRDVTLGHLLPT